MAFYNALMHVLVEENLIDETFIRDRTENFDALKEMVERYPPSRVAPVYTPAPANPST